MPSATEYVHTPAIILPEFCHNRHIRRLPKVKNAAVMTGFPVPFGAFITVPSDLMPRNESAAQAYSKKTNRRFYIYNRSGTQFGIPLSCRIRAKLRGTGAIVTVKATGSEEQTAKPHYTVRKNHQSPCRI